jgi:hypothetical protein
MEDEKQRKSTEYAQKILHVLSEINNEDSEHYMDLDELTEDDNLTHFMHALANVAPAFFYKKLTGNEIDMLEFNHLSNRLVFQYSTRVKND